MKITRLSQSSNIDKNTLFVGKFKSVEQAKKFCKQKFGRLPRMGYEMMIEYDFVEITEDKVGTVYHGTHKFKYKTYLAYEAGGFRLWTWIDVNPARAQDYEHQADVQKYLDSGNQRSPSPITPPNWKPSQA